MLDRFRIEDPEASVEIGRTLRVPLELAHARFDLELLHPRAREAKRRARTVASATDVAQLLVHIGQSTENLGALGHQRARLLERVACAKQRAGVKRGKPRRVGARDRVLKRRVMRRLALHAQIEQVAQLFREGFRPPVVERGFSLAREAHASAAWFLRNPTPRDAAVLEDRVAPSDHQIDARERGKSGEGGAVEGRATRTSMSCRRAYHRIAGHDSKRSAGVGRVLPCAQTSVGGAPRHERASELRRGGLAPPRVLHVSFPRERQDRDRTRRRVLREGTPQLERVGEAALRRALQAPQDGRFPPRVEVGHEALRGRSLAREAIPRELREGVFAFTRRERQPTRHQLEEQNAERVEIGPWADGTRIELLRRHVDRRPHNTTRRAFSASLERQAEVGHHRALLACGADQHHVRTLKVSMGHARDVRRVKRPGQLPHQRKKLAGRPTPHPRRPLVQGLAGEKLHRDEVKRLLVVPRGAEVEHAADVWMRDAPGEQHLALEPFDRAVIACDLGADRLERERAAE